jgi:hypothetical protein
MRPYVFGIAALLGWTLVAAGVVANLAGVDWLTNRPIVNPPAARAVGPGAGPHIDASVPVAEGPSVAADRSAL